MKRIIPIILILLILVISVYSYIDGKAIPTDETKLENELNNEEEFYYADVRLPEDPRLTSNYEVKDINKVLNFIDPTEMQNYDDLLTLYAAYLPMIIDEKVEDFYDINQEEIRHLLGIYSLEDYLVFYDSVVESGITKNSLTDHIEVIEVVKEGNLLKSTIRTMYDNARFETTHYLNYLYIEKESYLYLYTLLEVK